MQSFSKASLVPKKMIWAKIPARSFLLFTALITLFHFSPRFCKAQNSNTTGNASERCGAFGIFNSQNTPACTCLRGFGPRNRTEWDSGNRAGGCVRRVPLQCGTNNSEGSGFLMVQMVLVPGYTSRWYGPAHECPRLCLMNCSCIAYAPYHQDSALGCYFWNTTLFGIQRLRRGMRSDLYFRVANSELGPKNKSKRIIIALVVSGLVILSISLCISWKWTLKQRGQKTISLLGEAGASQPSSSLQDVLSKFNLEDLPLFEYEVLEIATEKFSNDNTLGKGGFGRVYKGKLADGRVIAVKRLSKASGQGMQEFLNEVLLISKLQHRNLVRLLGCCVENNEKMLIYECMPNQSLDIFLFDQSQEILDWDRRSNIINGICRGLLYLHRDSRLKIVHRDLKPSNILLDNEWNPKISDFGLARIFENSQDHVSTVRVVGTYGYMAPEYAIEGRFSEKSDVFSFGVLMLEIISGRRNTSFYGHNSLNLLGHVSKLWTENNILASIDKRLILNPSNEEDVVRFIHIGLLCVQELPKDRPSISVVLAMLNSEIVELPEPKQVAFAIKSSRSSVGKSSSQQSQKISGSSLNSMTLTVVDGR